MRTCSVVSGRDFISMRVLSLQPLPTIFGQLLNRSDKTCTAKKRRGSGNKTDPLGQQSHLLFNH